MNTLDRAWLSYYINSENILNIQHTRKRRIVPQCEKPSWRQRQLMGSNSENNRIRKMIDTLGKALTGDPSVVMDISPQNGHTP